VQFWNAFVSCRHIHSIVMLHWPSAFLCRKYIWFDLKWFFDPEFDALTNYTTAPHDHDKKSEKISELLSTVIPTPYTHLRHSVMTLINVFYERYIMNITAFMISYHHSVPVFPIYLRPKGHDSFELPRCALELHKKSFLPRRLFKYVYLFNPLCLVLYECLYFLY